MQIWEVFQSAMCWAEYSLQHSPFLFLHEMTIKKADFVQLSGGTVSTFGPTNREEKKKKKGHFPAHCAGDELLNHQPRCAEQNSHRNIRLKCTFCPACSHGTIIKNLFNLHKLPHKKT